MATSQQSSIECAKERAAHKAVDTYVKDGMVVGVGSGSTVVYAVNRLAERVEAEKLNIMCVPTSFQSRELLREKGLPFGDLTTNPDIDVCIDGADEVDADLNVIKGGGGCHLQEKLVASNAKTFVIIADHRKESQHLSEKWKKGVPIAVVAQARITVKQRIEKDFEGAKCVLRMAKAKAGPCVDDNGMLIYDVHFPTNLLTPDNLNELDTHLHLIPGIMETGLFVGMAERAYFGQADGSVTTRESKRRKVEE